MSTTGDRIKLLRERLGLTQQGLSDLLHVTRGAVANWERDKGIKQGNIALIARKTGASVDWLTVGDAADSFVDRAKMRGNDFVAVASIPVQGFVATGLWMDDNEQFTQDVETIPATPGYDPGLQVAFLARGASMELAGIHDGTFVTCLKFDGGECDVENGDIVVVTRDRGGSKETTCKIFFQAGDKIELRPSSRDKKHLPIVVPDRKMWLSEDGARVTIVGRVISTTQLLDRRSRRPRG